MLLSRLENVGISIQTFFCSFQNISSMVLEFFISVVSKFAIESKTEHTGDNAEQVKITKNEVGSTNRVSWKNFPLEKLLSKVKLMESHAESY